MVKATRKNLYALCIKSQVFTLQHNTGCNESHKTSSNNILDAAKTQFLSCHHLTIIINIQQQIKILLLLSLSQTYPVKPTPTHTTNGINHQTSNHYYALQHSHYSLTPTLHHHHLPLYSYSQSHQHYVH